MEGDKLCMKIIKTWPDNPPQATEIVCHFGDGRVITGLPRNEIEEKLMERHVSATDILKWKGLPDSEPNVVLVAYTALQAVKEWPMTTSSSKQLPLKKRPRPAEEPAAAGDEVGLCFIWLDTFGRPIIINALIMARHLSRHVF